MIKRGASLSIWTLVGAVLTYGSLYALTPFGFVIIGVGVAIALGLRRGRRSPPPEALGVLAGVGAFFLLVAESADTDDSASFFGVGLTLVAGAVLGYALLAGHLARRAHP